MTLAQDMKHCLARGHQVVRDDAPMTAPPHGFRAHDCAAPRMSQLPQLGKAGAEGVGHGVVGVVMKALVLPKGVYDRRDLPTMASQPSKRRDVDVANLDCGQCLR